VAGAQADFSFVAEEGDDGLSADAAAGFGDDEGGEEDEDDAADSDFSAFSPALDAERRLSVA
jgi:hypothetical protein